MEASAIAVAAPRYESKDSSIAANKDSSRYVKGNNQPSVQLWQHATNWHCSIIEELQLCSKWGSP